QRVIEFRHEERIVDGQGRDEAWVQGEVVLLRVARPARPAVPVQCLVKENVSPFGNERLHVCHTGGPACVGRTWDQDAKGGRQETGRRLDTRGKLPSLLAVVEPFEKGRGTEEEAGCARVLAAPRDDHEVDLEASRHPAAEAGLKRCRASLMLQAAHPYPRIA